MATQPDLILQLAHRIGADYTRDGRLPRVYADALVSLNGRRAAALIDPEVDLLTVHDGLSFAGWILPAPISPPAQLE